MLLDIHSHILPAVDDGAEDLIESLHLLELMQSQGITDCIATPHFYPHEDNLEDFLQEARTAFEHLKKIVNERKLPNIYLGCEMLYYEGIGNSESLSELCLNGSDFLLLELYDGCINNTLFEDLKAMKEKLFITPVIAHIERYCDAKNYRKLLKFVKDENIPVQINAASLLIPEYNRTVKKIFKSDIKTVIATDAHSVKERPPKMAEALREVNLKLGREFRTKIMETSHWLFEKIVTEIDYNA
ncbi:MAG: hypothetical protein IKB45_02000 [Clostridia bacterium]|nr:hypothetical protein [Clostridia bacterium]